MTLSSPHWFLCSPTACVIGPGKRQLCPTSSPNRAVLDGL